ncbi:MAG: glycosyltransferase, partial [Candidatus Gastranaerophilales bacterium]|nr:glycosyltransferase [Candidatus Gastranaerophilales bacterium]
MILNKIEIQEKQALEPKSHNFISEKTKKIAVISDQIAGGIGGAESILFALYELYPDIKTYTTVFDSNIFPKKYKNMNIQTTWIQQMPFAKNKYKVYFPLMPMAIESLDLQEYDVLISSHHCVAKGIIPRPDAFHICYCHSPARYIWDLYWTYSKLNNFNIVQKIITSYLSHYLRMWDCSCSNRVSLFLANSNYTASRIKKFYNRNSEILYPPVDTEKFKHQSYGDYYLMVGRLVAYKGYELAVDAFNENGKKLVIIGDGTEYKKLKSKANDNIIFLGRVCDEILKEYMNNCKGFIFPGKEDFGMVMAEAQAAG